MNKTCTRCGETKSVEKFSKRKALRDGLRSECKACEKKDWKKYREANSEHLKAKNRAWHKANPEYQATWNGSKKGQKNITKPTLILAEKIAENARH